MLCKQTQQTYMMNLCVKDHSHHCGRPSTAVNEETAEIVNKLVAMTDDCQTLLSLLASLLAVHIQLGRRICWWKKSLHDGCCLKEDHTETSASLLNLSLFNETPDNFISRFVTVDETVFITLILKVKRKVWLGNMSLLHLPYYANVIGMSSGTKREETRIIASWCHLVCCFTRSHIITSMHVKYSPDLAAPSDFYLFPKLKKFTKGCKFIDD